MAYPQKQISLDKPIGFGKFQNKTAAQVLEENPEYLLWLRHERWKDAVMVNGFRVSNDAIDFEVHALLDTYLKANPKLITKKGYGYSYKTEGEAQAAPTPKLEPEVAKAKEPELEGWGAW